MPVYIEKSGDLIGCYHSGPNEQTNKQGKIELLSHWTMEGWDEQLTQKYKYHLKLPYSKWGKGNGYHFQIQSFPPGGRRPGSLVGTEHPAIASATYHHSEEVSNQIVIQNYKSKNHRQQLVLNWYLQTEWLPYMPYRSFIVRCFLHSRCRSVWQGRKRKTTSSPNFSILGNNRDTCKCPLATNIGDHIHRNSYTGEFNIF